MIRLQKVLADRGVASRRRAESLITEGRVRVDGEVVTTLGTRVRPDARIDVDGARTDVAVVRHIALNKPKGVMSTARDERGRRSVVDLIDLPERLYPVGRLDADSEGLLLLTNDGEWAEHVLHPRYGHEREYDVTVVGEITPAALEQLRRGVRLEEGIARAERVTIAKRSRAGSRIHIVLRTGWKRQVRRMCAAVGLRVERLVRIRIASLMLGDLRAGEWRPLTAKEIADLARPVQREGRPVHGPGRDIEDRATARTGRRTERVATRAEAAAPRAPAPRGTPRRPRRGVR
ncbi:MAG TPA: pseudouridine synthase, partial [Candidatus Limnocylindria bacterium]